MTQQEIRKRFNCIIIVLLLAIALIALEAVEPSPSPSGAATADVSNEPEIAMQTLCKNTCADMCGTDKVCFKECEEHYCPHLAKYKAVTTITGTI